MAAGRPKPPSCKGCDCQSGPVLETKHAIGGGRSAKPTVRGFWVTSGSGSYGFPRPGALTPCPGAVAPCPAAVWLHAPALWLHAPALWLHAPQLCGSANIVQRPRDCSTARKEDNSRACRWFWRGRGGEGASSVFEKFLNEWLSLNDYIKFLFMIFNFGFFLKFENKWQF